MTKYKVRLPETAVEVEASIVNIGQRKLWLWDEEWHLIAVFVWEKIIGFEVIGSAQDQKFTNDLLHERNEKNQQTEQQIQQKGEIWVKLNDVRKKLQELSSTLNVAWVQVYDACRNKSSETSLLVAQHEADLRQLQAQIIDDQKSLNSRIDSILSEFTVLFSKK